MEEKLSIITTEEELEFEASKEEQFAPFLKGVLKATPPPFN